MAESNCGVQNLAFKAMPDVAAALRKRMKRILDRWDQAIKGQLPHAEPQTRQQIRDTIPLILEQIARALESDEPSETEELFRKTVSHGETRFQQAYNIEEVLAEYRFLRCIVIDELHAELGDALTVDKVLAVDGGIDITIQQSVAAYSGFQTAQLRAAAEAQALYLSFLSHDQRNNLNSIVLTMEVLRRRLAPLPEFAEDVADIESLQRTIDDTVRGMDRLLQAERLRKQAFAIKPEPIALKRIVADVVVQLQPQAERKRLQLAAEVPAGARVIADRELIAMILQNLLGNAIKYSDAGTIFVRATRENDQWRLAVIDQGPGIPQDQLSKLFDAFHRGATHGQEGVGLGLSIASRAATLLGSSLSVESAPGKGSTFWLTLPVAVG